MLTLGRVRSGRTLLGTLVLAVTALLTLTGSVTAGSTCKNVNGKFTLQPVSGPECASPVGVCASGTFIGDIKGTSTFVATSLIQSADTPTTGVVFITGNSVISTARGAISTKDSISLKTTDAGEFAEVDVLVGGTDSLAGSTGTLTATGTFTADKGGEGVYAGRVCAP